MRPFCRIALPLILLSLTSLAAEQTTTPAFDVASVKPNKSGDRGTMVQFAPGGRFVVKNGTLKLLIELAYDVRDFQITGGPSWINSDKYDIEATGAETAHKEGKEETEEERKADLDRHRQMIQSLLADRFKLKLHKESKETQIYALVVAKGGLKIKELPHEAPPAEPQAMPDKPDPAHPPRGMMRMGPGELTAHGGKIGFLTDALSNVTGRKVVDETGLKGDYDFDLKWTPDEVHGPGDAGGAGSSGDSSGPSVFTALQEQLGLKLESKKGRVDLLVIDQAEKASQN